MKIFEATALLGAFAMLAVFVPRARATENEKTIITFNEPVEVPGVVLEPGTYTFKLLNAESDRDIVEISGKNDHLYATVLALPDQRLQMKDRSVITFEHVAPNSPEAIKAWFYPGSKEGLEFVYPEARARQLARLNNEDVMCMSSDMQQNITSSTKSDHDRHVKAMKKASVMAMSKSGNEKALTTALASSGAKH